MFLCGKIAVLKYCPCFWDKDGDNVHDNDDYGNPSWKNHNKTMKLSTMTITGTTIMAIMMTVKTSHLQNNAVLLCLYIDVWGWRISYCHVRKWFVSKSKDTGTLSCIFLISLNIKWRYISEPLLDGFGGTLKWRDQVNLDWRGSNNYLHC